MNTNTSIQPEVFEWYSNFELFAHLCFISGPETIQAMQRKVMIFLKNPEFPANNFFNQIYSSQIPQTISQAWHKF